MPLAAMTKATLRSRLAGDWGLRGATSGTAHDDGVTTVQASTLLVDAAPGVGLKDSLATSGRYNNAILELWGGTTSTAMEWTRLANASYAPAAGSLTVGRAFATTPISGTTPYTIHTHGFTPDELNNALSWAGRNLLRPVHKALCGLLEPFDGDMEANGTTNWTGSSATVSKVTAEATVGLGEQALLVVNSGANGYAASAALPVRESRVLTVLALVRVVTGIASLVVRDRTNNATVAVAWQQIDSVDAAHQTDWELLAGTCTLPANCVSIEVRLQNSSAAGQTYWDDVCVYRADDLALDLPVWIADPLGQILDVLTWASSYVLRDSRQLVKLRPLRKPFGNVTGQSAWRLPIPGTISAGAPYWGGAGALNRPVVLEALKPIGELSAESSSVPDYLAESMLAGALYRLFELGARPLGLDSKEFAVERERARADWDRLRSFETGRASHLVWSS